MKIDRTRLKSVALEARRIALWPAILWVVYLILAATFGAVTGSRGLVSPDDLDLGLLLLGATTLALRIVALFGLPAIVVYRVCKRLLRTREKVDIK